MGVDGHPPKPAACQELKRFTCFFRSDGSISLRMCQGGCFKTMPFSEVSPNVSELFGKSSAVDETELFNALVARRASAASTDLMRSAVQNPLMELQPPRSLLCTSISCQPCPSPKLHISNLRIAGGEAALHLGMKLFRKKPALHQLSQWEPGSRYFIFFSSILE